MEEQATAQQPLTIGYWNLRFHAQVPRLLCQYFSVPYANKLYLQPNDWVTDRASATFNDWIFVDLPYLIDKDVRLTEAIPIMTYIAEVYGPAGIMGKTPEDQTCVDMFLWSIDSVMKRLIRISCPKQSPEDAEKERIELWNLHVKEKLKFMETSSRIGEWFLGYITICDFVIYEMVSYLQLFFPGSTAKCVHLKRIAANVGNLDKIKEYENSDRAIKFRLPKEAWDKCVKPKVLEQCQKSFNC